jgi:stage V sporulation protein B
VPFSVIVGSFRGVFQGFYQMKNIFYSKFLEQIFTLIIASILVILGWYAAGAVLGTALGFFVSLIGSYLLFKRDVKDAYLNQEFSKISFREELSLMKEILKFSIPVVISGIAEIFLYDTGTFFIGMFLPTLFAGFYTNASAIARIPLILANSVSTSILPATSEADSLNDEKLLKMYMHQSYRYTTVTSLPVSAFIMVYAVPMMVLLFGNDYAKGSDALWILVARMFFFSIYLIACSMCQGLGKPTFPMYSLIIGALVNVVFSYILIPLYDISGAAIATTIATFVLMVLTVGELTKLSKIHPPYKDLLKMFVAAGVMIFVMYLLPHTIIGMFVGLVLGSMAYIIVILLLKAIKVEDIVFIEHFVNRSGPLKKYLMKFVYYAKIYLQE